MKIIKHDRYGILLLSAIAILLFISIGCSKSNESKIIGHWKTKSIDNIDGSIRYDFINFYKKGVVSKTTEIVANDKLSRTSKIMGKYKFENDNNIIIHWDDGKSEITNVTFHNENKMLLGMYEMEKIQ